MSYAPDYKDLKAGIGPEKEMGPFPSERATEATAQGQKEVDFIRGQQIQPVLRKRLHQREVRVRCYQDRK